MLPQSCHKLRVKMGVYGPEWVAWEAAPKFGEILRNIE
jgi:hypothetical protein